MVDVLEENNNCLEDKEEDAAASQPYRRRQATEQGQQVARQTQRDGANSRRAPRQQVQLNRQLQTTAAPIIQNANRVDTTHEDDEDIPEDQLETYKEIFRADVCKSVFKHFKFLDPSKSLLSAHGSFVFKAFAMAQVGKNLQNKQERYVTAMERWD